MDNSFKKIVKFNSVRGIENVIESWANEYGFEYDNSSTFPNISDMTYSFSFEHNESKTLVFISILDDKMFIEAMTIKDSFRSELSKIAIEDLLKKIKK